MNVTTSVLETKLASSAPGAYLFYGEEEYLKRHWLGRFRSALANDSDFAAFNHVIINNGDLAALEGELQSLPMLDMLGSGQRLIELRDTDFGRISKSDLEALCSMLSDTGDNVVIIYTLPDELSPGTKSKPNPAFKALDQVCSSVNFERQPPQKLVSWIGRHFNAKGCLCDTDTCRYMIEYCSADMFILSSETEKLCAYALSHGLSRIDIPMVNLVCSRSKVFGAFDLSNALLSRDISTALGVVSDMIRRKERPELIMSSLSGTYNELYMIKTLSECGMNQKQIFAALRSSTSMKNEYAFQLKFRAAAGFTLQALEKAMQNCTEADRLIKSAPINKYYLIEELILRGAL